MRTTWFVVLMISMVIATSLFAGSHAGEKFTRPIHTYSIVARDSLTGEIGVAVQSHWFSVGTVVSWAEAGVGAVATQSLADVSYGPLGLDLMRAGKSARQTLNALLEADDHPEWRQVAMIDAEGRVAVHTGSKCIREAGHRIGAQYAVQANLMETNTVWEAMANAYETARGDLAERMLAALEAAQNEKGDIRGKQSAAMLIVKPEPTGMVPFDRVVDLRIEDHPEPIKELKRLLRLNQAYTLMNDGDGRVAAGDITGALEVYSRAMRLAPAIPELKFWAAVTMFTDGDETVALEYFKEVFEADARWVEVAKRLPEAGLLPENKKKMEKILSVAP